MKSILLTLLLILLPTLANAEPNMSSKSHAACAIKSGVLYCWGKNNRSQVGNALFGGTWSTPQAAFVAGSSGYTAVSLYDQGACAVVSGAVKCWGDNTFGQLGLDPIAKPFSTSAKTLIASGATEVAAGLYHVCALTTGGGVKCWGDNSMGQLGNGTYVSSLTPVSAIASGATAITSNGMSTCAMGGGAVYCWGLDHGNASPAGQVNVATAVTALSSGVTAISGGSTHMCAIQGSWTYCWGDNTYGQLGTGGTTASKTPVSTGLSSATAISLGIGSSCAIKATNVWCWGYNNRGQSGIGVAGANVLSPIPVTGATSMSFISAGTENVYTLDSGGIYRSWGDNTDRQIGGGTLAPNPRLTPYTFTVP